MTLLHSQPDARKVMQCYRRHILNCKKKYGTARSQVFYKQYLALYLQAKIELLLGSKI